MQIFLSIDPFLDKPKPSAMPDWDARRRFGVFFVGVSGLLWPVLYVWVAACAGLPQPRAGLSGHEANMEELGCMGAPLGYGRCMKPENP